MTDLTKILDKAKELESKMKESQKKIKVYHDEAGKGVVQEAIDNSNPLPNKEENKLLAYLLLQVRCISDEKEEGCTKDA